MYVYYLREMYGGTLIFLKNNLYVLEMLKATDILNWISPVT